MGLAGEMRKGMGTEQRMNYKGEDKTRLRNNSSTYGGSCRNPASKAKAVCVCAGRRQAWGR